MYLVGAPHPSRKLLEEHLRANTEVVYVTSVEVYQEIIHRYVAIDRREGIADAFELLDHLVHVVYPIQRRDIEQAHEIALAQKQLSGRDCLHIAVMRNHGIEKVLTLDQGFELWPGIQRIP